MSNYFSFSYLYDTAWGEPVEIYVNGDPKNLAIAVWFVETAKRLNLAEDYWADAPQMLMDLITWERGIDGLFMSSTIGDIMKTATAYNGGTTPEWRDAVIYFIAFAMGIDPIDVPEQWGEIM